MVASMEPLVCLLVNVATLHAMVLAFFMPVTGTRVNGCIELHPTVLI